jgi:uncharacterized protein (DUF1778 family)
MRAASSSVRERRGERVNLRLSSSAKETLERAAELSGLTLTDYILHHMLEMARTDIERAMRRRLSESEVAALLKLAEQPGAEPTERMLEAVERYNRLIVGIRD